MELWLPEASRCATLCAGGGEAPLARRNSFSCSIDLLSFSRAAFHSIPRIIISGPLVQPCKGVKS